MAQVVATKAWTGTRDRLSELTTPLLVANGVDDIMISSYDANVLAHEAPYAALLLYPDAGHGFLFRYVADFAGAVDWFLAPSKTIGS